MTEAMSEPLPEAVDTKILCALGSEKTELCTDCYVPIPDDAAYCPECFEIRNQPEPDGR